MCYLQYWQSDSNWIRILPVVTVAGSRTGATCNYRLQHRVWEGLRSVFHRYLETLAGWLATCGLHLEAQMKGLALFSLALSCTIQSAFRPGQHASFLFFEVCFLLFVCDTSWSHKVCWISVKIQKTTFAFIYGSQVMGHGLTILHLFSSSNNTISILTVCMRKSMHTCAMYATCCNLLGSSLLWRYNDLWIKPSGQPVA